MFNSGKTIGDLNDNLTLQTKGKVYIQFGKKTINLLNNKGELDVNFSNIFKKVKTLQGLTSGLYEYQNDLYIIMNGQVKKFQLQDVSV